MSDFFRNKSSIVTVSALGRAYIDAELRMPEDVWSVRADRVSQLDDVVRGTGFSDKLGDWRKAILCTYKDCEGVSRFLVDFRVYGPFDATRLTGGVDMEQTMNRDRSIVRIATPSWFILAD